MLSLPSVGSKPFHLPLFTAFTAEFLHDPMQGWVRDTGQRHFMSMWVPESGQPVSSP